MDWFSFIFGTVFGAVLGAILSVTADRLWRRYETRIHISIHPYFFDNAPQQVGIGLRIANAGKSSIPPYKLCIYHPELGALYHIDQNGPQELRPGQENDHRVVLLENGKPAGIVQMWYRAPEIKPTRVCDGRGYVFRLILDKSDRVLYSNAVLGNALAAIARAVKQANGMGEITTEHLAKLRV